MPWFLYVARGLFVMVGIWVGVAVIIGQPSRINPETAVMPTIVALYALLEAIAGLYRKMDEVSRQLRSSMEQ